MPHPNRRRFISSVAALAGAATALADSAQASPIPQSDWDMSWLDRLTGKHKQVFDLHEMDSLRIIKNWLDAYLEVYGLGHPDVNPVVGIAGSAFPVNATDALYQKYPIGELWKVTDPETQKPALRNIFLSGGKTPREQQTKVKALQARGTIFWQCNKALTRQAGRIAEAAHQPEEEVYRELRGGLNPGVILVPAHTMLVGLCQERGCTYESLS
ncbi:MAG: hypothetical protein ABI647_02270 [Gemmatimonadota bacterium]